MELLFELKFELMDLYQIDYLNIVLELLFELKFELRDFNQIDYLKIVLKLLLELFELDYFE